MQPALSIVIPTYNRGQMLERCLGSIVASVGPAVEIIVSDDGSDDDSRKRFQRIARLRPSLRWISAPRTGPAGARNRGWRSSRGKVVAFVDDDCLATPGWVEALLRPFSEAPDIAGVEGKTKPETPVRGFFHHSIESARGSFLSCNIAFRRNVLEQLGGFDEGFPFPHGEDIDLCYRIIRSGRSIEYAPDAIVLHAVVPVGPWYYLRRTRMDASTYRLFVRQPECLRKALDTVHLPRFLKDPVEEPPRFRQILAYILSTRLMHAYFCLRDGRSLGERLLGCVTHLACIPLSLWNVPRGMASYREAVGS